MLSYHCLVYVLRQTTIQNSVKASEKVDLEGIYHLVSHPYKRLRFFQPLKYIFQLLFHKSLSSLARPNVILIKATLGFLIPGFVPSVTLKFFSDFRIIFCPNSIKVVVDSKFRHIQLAGQDLDSPFDQKKSLIFQSSYNLNSVLFTH